MGETTTPTERDAPPVHPLRNRECLFLFSATFLAYANVSVFFQFYAYLRTLPVDPRGFGILMGVFSAVSLILRPLISPFFHRANARRWLYVGTGMVMASLSLYGLAGGFWSLFLVRALHGLAFVVLGTALMTMTIEYIPKDRSAQFFGFLSIIILIPNTLVPPVLPLLSRGLGGFNGVLLLFAGISALVFPLIRGVGAVRGEKDPSGASAVLGFREILADLANPRVSVLLTAMLLLYCGHALVFFFLDGYGRFLGFAGTGFFLTLSSVSEMGIRVTAGTLFDRINKTRLAGCAMVGLALAYAALAHVPGRVSFFALGAVLGLGWGVAMPVFNGLMFDISEARLRAFNINLGLQMFQGGFFLGPFIGGPVAAHWGFAALYQLCAVLSLLSAGLVLFMGGKVSE
ncbi:MAG: MFS transporter [Deltaproteobacteria bacterium]|nr:MFS transporter [Deltaproteobacteria bacterium]